MNTGAMKDDLDPRKEAGQKKGNVLSREVYYKDDIIVHQGSEGYRAYYIERGRVAVLVHEGTHELKVAELTAGDLFGEMALISHEPRSATVRALEETVVTIISREELEEKIEKIEDDAMRALITVMAARLRAATQGQLMHYKNLADFQDRVTGLIDRAHMSIDDEKRDAFRNDVAPLLNDLQTVLDRYQK